MKNMCNCIALYDFTAEKTDVKSWFYFMDNWVQNVGIPWESASNLSGKLILYKNARKKYEKLDFQDIDSLGLLGGVSEPGTHLDWKTCNSLSVPKNGLSGESYLCFPNDELSFTAENLRAILKQLLECADFKYGICYQRPYNLGPAAYASGTFAGLDRLSEEEADRIWLWSKKYFLNPHYYRTGLLRDVYPHNILIDQHLSEKVSDATLGEWIKSSPNHGTLEKITEHHWLWSIDPQHIPVAQEVLQEASLLLCYKV
jgi:hypothetical protein